jgi:short subunit dehydrogenase-like uncharacterized protein
MSEPAEFDVVIWGASGYVGRIIAERFVARRSPMRWALAGRNLARLAEVRDAVGGPADTPLLVADAADPASLTAMLDRTRMVLSAVGPYQVHGSGLVAACAERGVDYVDLSGEPRWARRMIELHEDAARRSGARIVFSAAFDSVPFELGVQLLQEAATARWGAPLPAVRSRVSIVGGDGFSGGTIASLAAEREAGPAGSPLVLPSGFAGPEQPLPTQPAFDDELGVWVAPWVLAPITLWNLHWSNALRGFAWGRDLTYEEMVVTGPGPDGRETAAAVTALMADLLDTNTREPGDGPDQASGEAASYAIQLIGSDGTGRRVSIVVTGQGDPGYRSSARIVTEVVHALVEDRPDAAAGIWTPGALLGGRLVDRLAAAAGLTFAVT